MYRLKQIGKKGLKAVAYLFFLGFSVLLLLEVCYRNYWVDFYAANLNGLNSSEELKNTADRSTILVMGDSFTADHRSYVRDLRDSLKDYRTINAAVPGTCVKQSHLMIRHRIKTFQPDVLIYQIYLGNDLFEYRHRNQSNTLSKARRWYWWLSDRFWVLSYINSRLPHIRQAMANDLPRDYDPKTLQDYAPEKYSRRSRLQFQAEPYLLEHTILLKGQRKADFIDYLSELNEMLEEVPEPCKVFLLVLPHCIQLNETYQSRMMQIGAKMDQKESLSAINYLFYQQLKKGIKRPAVHFLNALPILQSGEKEAPMYYGNDPHLNAAGQRKIGAYVLNQVRE